MTSLSLPGVAFFLCCAMGVVGTATNGLVLYAMVASKQHKKQVLIFNQNVLDLFTCISIVVSNSLKFSRVQLSGSLGYLLCTLLLSDCLTWIFATGSNFNLASVTVERYLKVVHSAWSKTKLRKWIIYSAGAFAWIGALLYHATLAFSTTDVIDGQCYVYTFWQSDTANAFELFYNFVTFYVVIILIFIFCYWRILTVIHRQASVMAGHAAAGPITAAQTQTQAQYNQIQSNVAKTMVFVCAFHAISWLPIYIYMLNVRLNINQALVPYYYVALMFAYLYMCTNPFFYATKFDPVRKVLLRLNPCKKTTE